MKKVDFFMDMQKAIEYRLQVLQPQLFEFHDESSLHIGHAGNRGGGHYMLVVVSSSFINVSRLNRQRIIKDLLRDLFSGGLIHALSIKAATPQEYFGLN